MRPLEGAVGPDDHVLRRSLPDVTTPPAPGARVIDAEKVVTVALNPDDELRNLQVALLYSLTSARLAEQLGGPQGPMGQHEVNANWFTIGQWAVLTVGRSMRTSDVPHRAAALPQGIRRRLTPAILSLRAADDRRVATALSFGQVMVFVSMYRALLRTEFSDVRPLEEPVQLWRPVEADNDGGHPSSDPNPGLSADDLKVISDMAQTARAAKEQATETARQEDLAKRETVKRLALQMGAKVADFPTDGGVDRNTFYEGILVALADESGFSEELGVAFDLYLRAAKATAIRSTTAERTRADLIFEGTLRMAAIEQTILDKAVTAVVDHLPRHLSEQLEGRMATFAERSLHVPRRIAELNSARRISRISAAAQDVWARIMTDQVMVIALPAETIRLGRDMPRRDWRKPFYTEALANLSPSADGLYRQFDRSLGDGRGAGAGDWRRFDDRMNFVANLLRSRQQDSTLFWQPFTDEDVGRLWQGAYPARIADPFEQAVRTPSFPDDLRPEDLDPSNEDCVLHVEVRPIARSQGLPLAVEEPTS